MTDPNRDTESVLNRVAEDIADGSEPLWNELSTPAAEEMAELRGLQTIAQVAAAHRSEWPEQGGPPTRQQESPSGARREPGQHPTVWGDLEILEHLDRGAFGDVYRARDRNLDRIVALKLLDPESSESEEATMKVDEARLLARVDHTNVARVYGAQRIDGRIGIWMEFVPGSNLQEILDESGTFSAREIRDIGQSICDALAAVHAAGIIHRDIKPRNVLRKQGTGDIVLTDFGISTFANRERPEGNDPVVGTIPYMAPELFRGAQATARSDIYSLGVLLFYIASSAYPVPGNGYSEIARAHQEGRRVLLSDLRPDLNRHLVEAIEKAIAPNPEQRYRTVGEFWKAIANRHGSPIIKPLLAAAATVVVAIGVYAWYHRPYQVDATMIVVRDMKEEVLHPGASITPGDQLLLEIESTRPLHVYVVSYDDFDKQFLLFPMGSSDLKNPIPPAKRTRLPGTRNEKQLAWRVTSFGGREHIVVVASPRRLKEFEAEIAQMNTPEYSPLSANALGRLRGVGEIGEYDGSSGAVDPKTLFKPVPTLIPESKSVRGAWVRQVDLMYKTQ